MYVACPERARAAISQAVAAVNRCLGLYLLICSVSRACDPASMPACCLFLPLSVQSMLSQMLSSTPAARPNAAAFSGCQWFQEDMLLRCLKFIDTILQRDTGQKVSRPCRRSCTCFQLYYHTTGSDCYLLLPHICLGALP
jgi:hypothetical protein